MSPLIRLSRMPAATHMADRPVPDVPAVRLGGDIEGRNEPGKGSGSPHTIQLRAWGTHLTYLGRGGCGQGARRIVASIASMEVKRPQCLPPAKRREHSARRDFRSLPETIVWSSSPS